MADDFLAVLAAGTPLPATGTAHGHVRLPDGTLARVAWELHEDAGGTAVRLSAEVANAALPDRLLLALGARAWMKRRFDANLAPLDEQLS